MMIHPETQKAERIEHPWRVATHNSVVALVGCAVGSAFYAVRYWQHLTSATWVWLLLIAVGVLAVTFGQAFLGAKIGGLKAARVFGMLLLIVLVGGVVWLTRALHQPL